jgi:hypothetical protein
MPPTIGSGIMIPGTGFFFGWLVRSTDGLLAALGLTGALRGPGFSPAGSFNDRSFGLMLLFAPK